MIAWTHDNTGSNAVRLYIDGPIIDTSLVNETETGTGVMEDFYDSISGLIDTSIGARFGSVAGADLFFNGRISNVATFDYVLSATEIQDIATAGGV